MKKLIFIFNLLFLIVTSGYSQCEGEECNDANMNFNPTGWYPNDHPDWQTSHGSPSVNVGQVWLWSANNIGEGINYSAFNFIEGRQYCVSFVATTVVRGGGLADPGAFFRVAATQGNVVGPAVPPLPVTSQVIANENFNATAPPSTNSYTYTFTATDDFDNLWIHPFSATMPIIELTFMRLRICDVTPQDPCDKIGFSLQLTEHSSGSTAIGFTPTGIPGGASVEMQIIKDGLSVYSGLPISYLATPASYTICMRVTLEDDTVCTKCFDFCTGKWYSKNKGDGDDQENEVNSYKNQLNGADALEFPEELKEKNIEEFLNVETVSVFPNPTTGDFSIAVSEEQTSVSSVEIYSLTSGKFIKNIALEDNKANASLSEQKAGVYIVKVTFKDGRVIDKKIMLEKE